MSKISLSLCLAKKHNLDQDQGYPYRIVSARPRLNTLKQDQYQGRLYKTKTNIKIDFKRARLINHSY